MTNNLSDAIEDGITLYILEDIIKKYNITTDDEGNAMHCNEHMQVGNGLIGTDIATCKVCGLQIVNMHSPHINGGHMFDDIETNRTSWYSNRED